MRMKEAKIKKELSRGFTLLEVMVTVLILSFLVGALYVSMNAGQRTWEVNRAQIDLQRELRKSMEQIKKDLFETGSAAIVDVPADDVWYTSITFHIPNTALNGSILWESNTFQYILGGTGLTELHRINSMGPATDIVAHDIQSVQFRRQSATPNIMEVALVGEDITLKGNSLTYQLNFELELRN